LAIEVSRTIISEPFENDGIPRAMVPVMAPVMTPGYSAESFLRRGAFDVGENLQCESCRD
jgi:hypothetical protein